MALYLKETGIPEYTAKVVLVEREDNMRGLKKVTNKRLFALLMVVSTVVMLTGCGSSSNKMSAASSPSAMMQNSAVMGTVTEEALMDTGSFGGNYEMKADGEIAESPVTEEGAATALESRKLIKTVDMNVETQEFDVLMTTIESQVNSLGGYIENMNTYNGSSYYYRGGTRSADMSIRIPKNHLDTFLNTVTDISNVIRRSDNVEDVTLAYVDLESHRDALRTEQTRLLELLEKAESIEDIITIEERLSNIRYKLESMESQLRTYDNKVDYSTVYLNIEEVEVFTPVEEETVWERISGGFADSLQNIGNGFVEFGIWFVINIPYMVVWAVAIGLIVLVIVTMTKRRKKNKAKKEVDGWIPANITSAQDKQSDDTK